MMDEPDFTWLFIERDETSSGRVGMTYWAVVFGSGMKC